MEDKVSYLEEQLCFLFYVSSKEIIKKYTSYLKEHDLTYTGYIVMLAIKKNEKINIKTLGQRVYLDSGTLTPLLKKLEKKVMLVEHVKLMMNVIYKLRLQNKVQKFRIHYPMCPKKFLVNLIWISMKPFT